MTTLPDNRFRALDAGRGVAALAVVAYHFSWFFGIFLGRFVFDSYLFVDFFFVLSGFVISHAYLDRLAHPGEPARFVVRRFGRVWPLHAVMVFVIVATLMLQRHPPEFTFWTGAGINPIVTNLLLIHSLNLHPTLTLNVPSWSISVEFFAYLVFMVLAAWARRWMPWLAALLMAVSLALLAAFARRYMDTHNDLGFFRCLYGFFAGYFVYLIFTRWGALRDRRIATVIELAALAAIIWFVTIAGNGVSPVSLAAPFVFAPAVWVLASERGALSWLLTRAPFRFLGEVSYSIYMTHFLWVLIFPDLFFRLSRLVGIPIRTSALQLSPPGLATDLKIAIAFLLYFALVIALSAVTYRLIEQPGRRFFGRIAARMGSRRASAPVAVSDGVGAP